MKRQLSDGFKRSASCKNYQTVSTKVINQVANLFKLLSASFQGVKRLFVLAYGIAANAANNEAGAKSNRKYFLQKERLKVITYWLMEEIFMINQLMI